MKVPSLIISFIILFSSGNVVQGQVSNPNTADLIEMAMDSIEAPLPIVYPLFPYHIRDVAICKGPNHKYYLTGTTDDNWGVAEGIRVWESSDLKQWKLLGEKGFVWTFEKNGSTSQRKVVINRGRKVRGIWAPEIHYLKDNFWITYSTSNVFGSGLLKSKTGKPEGPYEDIKKDGHLVKGIDATLFEDTDGSVWYIWGPGKMKKMKPDMSGFMDEEPPIYPKDASGKNVGYEGVNIFYKNGYYYLMAAEWNSEGPNHGHIMRNTNQNRRAADGRYDCMVAISNQLAGPYNKAYNALSHGGHNVIFEDFEDNIWATMFGNDEAAAPFREQAALVPMTINPQNQIVPIFPYPFKANAAMPVIYVSPKGNNTDGNSWSTALNDLQMAIDQARPGTQIWVAAGTYSGSFKISAKEGLYLYGGFKGNEKKLEARSPINTPTVLDGSGKVSHVVEINQSSYVRLDGIIIQGGNAVGTDQESNGGGLYIKGGGESIRIVNTTLQNNYAIKDGGGFYATKGAGPTFINCTFHNNESQNNGGAAFIRCNEANGYHTKFYNCHFHNNKAQANGGVAYFTTDLKQTGTLRFINCLIHDNFTLLEWGNIVLRGGASLLMSHCTVVGNRGMSKGAAVATLGSVPAQNRIVNSIFSKNEGGTLFLAAIFSGKDAITGRPQDWTQLLHCLFHENATLSLCGYTHGGGIYENIESINSSSWGSGNVSGDPHFQDYEAGDFQLATSSSAINKGTADNAFPYDFAGQRRKIEMDRL